MDGPQAHSLFSRQTETPLHLIQLKTLKAGAFYFHHVMDCDFYKMQNQMLGCCGKFRFQTELSKGLLSLSILIADGDGSWRSPDLGSKLWEAVSLDLWSHDAKTHPAKAIMRRKLC